MKNKCKKLFALTLASALLVGTAASISAENVGGGVWDYGTKISGVNKKTVYSNYFHPTKTHKSSVTIGTHYASSGWVSKCVTSYASATGGWMDTTHAYYDFK